MTATIEDVLAGARTLATHPGLTAAALCDAAAEADAYRRETGRAHPDLGDGSICAAARLMRSASPDYEGLLTADSPRFLAGLRDMAAELLARANRRASIIPRAPSYRSPVSS
jgi:hypothetical protein